MGPEKPRRTWVIGGRTRLVLAVAGACVLLASGATVAAVRLTSRGPADPALAKLITEVTTVPVSAAVPLPAPVPVATPATPATPPPAGIPTTVINPVTGATAIAFAYSGTGNSSAVSSAYSSSLSVQFASPTKVSGPPLTAGGKPEVLYVATEYCPYCVAENWALIVALSRFGEFSGLSTSRSPYFEEVLPVDGWTFYGSSYTSPYLAFAPVESHSNVLVSPKADPADGKSYRALQPLTPADEAILGRLDKLRSTPFLDFGGRATLIGSGVPPDTLVGKTWSQIAGDLRHPQTPAGLEIIAAADMLTDEFCQLTDNRPATACLK
jgi:hypothetical protein